MIILVKFLKINLCYGQNDVNVKEIKKHVT